MAAMRLRVDAGGGDGGSPFRRAAIMLHLLDGGTWPSAAVSPLIHRWKGREQALHHHHHRDGIITAPYTLQRTCWLDRCRPSLPHGPCHLREYRLRILTVCAVFLRNSATSHPSCNVAPRAASIRAHATYPRTRGCASPLPFRFASHRRYRVPATSVLRSAPPCAPKRPIAFQSIHDASPAFIAFHTYFERSNSKFQRHS